MSKLKQTKIYIDLEKHNFVLTRIDDGKQIPCGVIKFIEWKDDGMYKASHDTPAVGRSIIADPGPYGMYQWLTSVITEVVSENEFKTKNSTYTLHKL